jgi:diguanylate cyclase (GGDEF)-like protein/PAS domain S-box-containing protein
MGDAILKRGGLMIDINTVFGNSGFANRQQTLGVQPDIFKRAVMDLRDGITISDNDADDNPLIFVNPAFERLTGYPAEDILGRNCRYLQGNDAVQPERLIIKQAIKDRQACLVTLRNCRADGTTFWNELSISPIFDSEGHVTNFIGIQKDVTDRMIMQQQLNDENSSLEELRASMEQLAIRDSLTGLYNRRFFDMQFAIQAKIAYRQGQSLTLIMIDVDDFKNYNDLYGHLAGDEALKTVAKMLNKSFQRSSDFVARFGGEEFVVLCADMTYEQGLAFTHCLCQRIRDLRIPHAASRLRYLTTSIGFAAHTFTPFGDPEMLLARADEALYAAKHRGRNQAVGFPASGDHSCAGTGRESTSNHNFPNSHCIWATSPSCRQPTT